MRTITLCILIFTCKGIAQSTAVADSLYATGNYTQAINTYATVGNTASNLQIARAYNAIGNYDKAIAQYEAVVNKDSDLRISRLELGKLYLKTKRYNDARKLFTKLVSDDNTNPEYFYYQGEAFRELEQFSSSLVAYKKAINIDSTHLRSLFQLGKYFMVKQENLQALEYIEKGLAFYPNDVALINLKALGHYNNNDYRQAIPAFERLLIMGEEKEHVYLKLAHSYYKEWEFEKAIKRYKALLEMDDSVSEAYNGLGEVYIKAKQLDSAEMNFKLAIAAQDTDLSGEYSSLAYVARQRNDLKTALEYYKMAYEEDMTNEMAYFQVCTVADQLYQDPKVRLAYYEEFEKKFKKKHPFFTETVEKRIRELQEEIHFADN
ncbi:tetratricopeptide repeat protein [Aggregatimonas sangjinii]|uniref:Tetratricopeptide repeat protein n=1 Tax=Aggregatimonas sangjinii TaxID=2583587 RepID=A0A5B7SRS0_9FLAO|nr:tetratricopeptide repeat protein [Aggregatimonas sangjinii]QCX01306.1 tetratricopeptide repeat protein [Aggregatimonas sangjinii]